MHRRAKRWIQGGLGIGLVLLLIQPAQAAGASDSADLPVEKVEQIVHDYLMRHPEVVYQALQELQRRQDEAKAAHQKEAVAANHAQLFQQTGDPVGGNPDGDVTLVEFFDYQCHYCRQVMPSLRTKLDEDKKLKVVFKDFPILGDNSVTAARAALAARNQGRYVPFHFALMSAKDLSLNGIMAVARSVGLDPQRLASDMNSPEIEAQIQANYALARTLGIDGTPAFVIGNELIPGALDQTRLTELIDEARTSCVSC
jgi:protein-disulfide isomerase